MICANLEVIWELSAMVTHPAYVRITPVMDQIETVVFLMLENRSLDNVLGWLYKGSAPAMVYPPGSSASFCGIPADAKNSYHDTSYSPTNGTAGFNEPCRVPAYDPYEPLEHVEKQLYADAYGKMPAGNFWSSAPPMTGFAWDYHALYELEPGQVMGAYNANQLPVLYGLAENFAVSDRWFCSVPTQTDPNRAFSVCGTSLGAETNSDIDSETYANSNTIFNALGSSGKTWGMYWQADNPLETGEPILSWAPFTSYYFSQIENAQHGGVDTYQNFLTALAKGNAPNFCFLEPFWGGGKGVPGGFVGFQGNDYHPPSWIGPAEDDLNKLYNALVSSPQWSKMLFILTFDEHGGNYDHVSPPVGLPPDSNVGKSGFAFDRFWVRVPMILISPYVTKGTVFRAPEGSKYDFDHTSFIATILKWAGVDPSSANLGARVGVAPTFEGVLSPTARADKPSFTVPSSYANQGGGVGHFVLIDSAATMATHDLPLDIHAFREAVDTSATPEEFVRRLDALARGR